MPTPENQTSTTAGPQAGWYRDPSGSPQLRWWDGCQWTSHMTRKPGYAAVPPAPQPPAHATPPSPPEAWELWTYDPGTAGTDPGATATGTDPRTSWKDRIKRHKVVSAVAALAVIAGIINTVNGGWGAAVLAILGVAAFLLARHSRRRWSAGCLTAITILSVFGIARDVPSAGHSAAAGSGNSSASSSQTHFCYLTIAGAIDSVYMALDGVNSDECGTVATQVQQITLGATVSVDSERPFPAGGGAVCAGTIDDYVATVVAPDGNDGGLCSVLGFGAVPL
jgi:hypothetical protein